MSRTGTTSLTSALKRLGYLSSHFENEFSLQLLESEDAFIFDAMTDTPVCIRFELLYHRFKNAKFVWTQLPQDRWFGAFDRHCMRVFGTNDFPEIRRFWKTYKYQPHVADAAEIDFTLYFQHDTVLDAYRAYCQRVENFFKDKPADKLLILETGGGQEWNKLCGFLGCDVPDEPYPWNNKS